MCIVWNIYGLYVEFDSIRTPMTNAPVTTSVAQLAGGNLLACSTNLTMVPHKPPKIALVQRRNPTRLPQHPPSKRVLRVGLRKGFAPVGTSKHIVVETRNEKNTVYRHTHHVESLPTTRNATQPKRKDRESATTIHPSRSRRNRRSVPN